MSMQGEKRNVLYPGLGIEDELIVLAAVLANRPNVDESSSLSNLENSDALEADGQNCQQVIVQEHPHVVGQVNEVIAKRPLIGYPPLRETVQTWQERKNDERQVWSLLQI